VRVLDIAAMRQDYEPGAAPFMSLKIQVLLELCDKQSLIQLCSRLC